MDKVKFLVMWTVVAVLMSGCGGEKGLKGEAIPVRVIKVLPRDLARALEYVGSIKGQDEALVYPKVSGKIIEKAKEEGDAIAKGEAILYIDRDEVGLEFKKAPVESPLSGVVGRIYVDIGSNVSPLTAVAFVSDMSGVKTTMSVPEQYVSEVAEGQKAVVTVDAFPGTEFPGEVTKVSPILDLETRAAPIEITIKDEKNVLHSGMFAKVKLILSERKGVPTILKEAVIGKEEDKYVYVVENNRAFLRRIKLGIHEGPYYEVTEGLKTGDIVVVMGQQKLRDGAAVAAEV